MYPMQMVKRVVPMQSAHATAISCSSKEMQTSGTPRLSSSSGPGGKLAR